MGIKLSQGIPEIGWLPLVCLAIDTINPQEEKNTALKTTATSSVIRRALGAT